MRGTKLEGSFKKVRGNTVEETGNTNHSAKMWKKHNHFKDGCSKDNAQQGTAQQGNTEPVSAEKKKRQKMPKSEKVTITKKLPINIRAPKYPLKEEMGQATSKWKLSKSRCTRTRRKKEQT